MLGQGLDRNQRLKCLSKGPVVGELLGMQFPPAASGVGQRRGELVRARLDRFGNGDDEPPVAVE